MTLASNNLKALTESFNEVNTGNFRGVDAFCKLLEIRTQLKNTQNGDYHVLKTNLEAFNNLLHDKYFLAAQQLYEGATDQHFLGSKRTVSEALSDLHLVPVYMALGKEAAGNKAPLTEQDWQRINVTKTDYDALVSTRLTDEARRVWELALQESVSYNAFTNLVHETGLLLQRAGVKLSDEKACLALGTTKDAFDAVLAQRQQKEQAQNPPYRIIPQARL